MCLEALVRPNPSLVSCIRLSLQRPVYPLSTSLIYLPCCFQEHLFLLSLELILAFSQMSSSSRNFLSHSYQNQNQRQHSQSRSPSLQSSSSSHPTAAPASPAFDPSLVHPGLSQNLGVPTRGISNLVDPTTSPAVPRLTGTTDLGDLTQQGPGPGPGPGPVRSGVRGVRSFSSPPLSIGLNASLSDSSLYPGANLGIQSASASAASGVPYQSRGRLSAAASAATNQRYAGIFLVSRPSSPIFWCISGN